MRVLVSMIFIVFLVSCQQKGQNRTLNVAVAANARFAIAEILDAFEQVCHCETEMIVGSSGQLTAQIEQGAPHHVFLSANMKYPEYLYARGIAVSRPEVYARGSLVLWSVDGGHHPSLEDLTAHQTKSVAIANPLNAPYGEAAVSALKKAGIYDRVKEKLVYGESIAQTTQFISTGSADLGITALSVVQMKQFAEQGAFTALPDTLYPAIKQGMVLLDHGNGEMRIRADAFRRFLRSPDSQRILARWGYH